MYLLFDIGKTKTRFASSNDLLSIGEPHVYDTPQAYEDFLALCTSAMMKFIDGTTLPEGIAGGIGASLNIEKTRLADGYNFPRFGKMPLAEDLRRVFGSKVILQNDAALAGLGEAVYGAGKGYSIVAYLTVSTGVGGSRIVEGKVDANVMGFEPGWQALSMTIPPQYASDYISGRAVEERMGVKPYEILDAKFWNEKADVLACVLNNISVFWSPDIIVVGGSMMKKIGIPLDTAAERFRNILKVYNTAPLVVPANLGDFGGLFGAMELLRQEKTK